MKKYLAKLDWNNMLRTKRSIECWDILKYVIERIIEQFVPLTKHKENGLEKKHLSKEAIRTIAYTQTM